MKDTNIEETLRDADAVHLETQTTVPVKLDRKNGDVALTLFPTVDEEPIAILSAKEVNRLQWKIDLLIIPTIAVCYCFFFIDKTTLSYAAIFGIKDDLNLHSNQYQWLSSIFYFGFLVWALPTNLGLQRFPVAKYLGINICLWGIFLMAQAAANSFKTLAVLRALGGAAEACADPAFLLITSMWYNRRQQPLKIGIWYTACGIGVALGGLLGYGIGSIHGSLASWKYEFIIVGALCTAWGIVIIVVLPDSPVTARGFSRAEKIWVVENLKNDLTGMENKHFRFYQLVEAFTDYKTYCFGLIAMMQAIVNGGITNFGTLIIQGFGFSKLGTTLMQIPYGAIIAFSILLCVWLDQKLPPNNRCILLIAFILPNIAGAFGLHYLALDNQGGRLTCYYLTASINASFVLLLSLQTGNIAGHTKKVVTNACLFLGYCVGNIAGPFFYKTDQQPYYTLGIWSMIGAHLIELVVVLVLRLLLQRDNKKRDKAQHLIANGADGNPVAAPHTLVEAFSDLTDRENLSFRYIY